MNTSLLFRRRFTARSEPIELMGRANFRFGKPGGRVASARLYRLMFLLCAVFAEPASAVDASEKQHLQNASFAQSTYLIDLQQGSDLSEMVLSMRRGGYELAGGRSMRFKRWYKSEWTDVSAMWMTQVTENFGIIFGGSTGERGKKYTISPSLKFGIVAQAQTGKNTFLSLRATTVLGGELKEKHCVADYGEIGGVQKVNCRMAASILPPAETLKYLLNEQPYNRNEISITLNWRF